MLDDYRVTILHDCKGAVTIMALVLGPQLSIRTRSLGAGVPEELKRREGDGGWLGERARVPI